MRLIQQGDVLLQEVRALPAGARKAQRSNRGWVLAEGESTGHAHVTRTAGCELLEAPGGQRFLSVKKNAAVVHEEHKSVTVPPGLWEVRRVREFDPFEERIREVAD